MIRTFSALVFFLVLFFLMSTETFAQSNYVLPYPSFMPGSKFYEFHSFWEKILKLWYFGNFGQFTYNLKLADKYLVEAKTLFEYKQYLLGVNALRKSNTDFKNAPIYLTRAKKENKDIDKNVAILRGAALKHAETLLKLEEEVPASFVWEPERISPTTLELKKSIQEAIAIRREIYD